MSEEELEAMESLRKHSNSIHGILSMREGQIILNLLEKQQKEIDNSVSKDVIKEQIKWLEHDIEKTKQNIAAGNNIRAYINDYRKIRMKAFVTKSKEIKSRLEKLLGE